MPVKNNRVFFSQKNMITFKTEQEIKELKLGGKILAFILQQLKKSSVSGIKLSELNQLAYDLIIKNNCQPSFLGYQSGHGQSPYPASLCASVNEELVHGPATRDIILNKGDLLKLDLGLIYPGSIRPLYLDAAITVGVGKISSEAKKLMNAVKKSLDVGIKIIRPGRYLHEISQAIQLSLEKNGYKPVRELVGHGVGYSVHEDPYVPNYIPESGVEEFIKLKEGMVLALEPMASLGHWRIKTQKDGFTIAMADRSISAQFEHTVAVTSAGHLILTDL